jgi:hypothetical protein
MRWCWLMYFDRGLLLIGGVFSARAYRFYTDHMSLDHLFWITGSKLYQSSFCTISAIQVVIEFNSDSSVLWEYSVLYFNTVQVLSILHNCGKLKKSTVIVRNTSQIQQLYGISISNSRRNRTNAVSQWTFSDYVFMRLIFLKDYTILFTTVILPLPLNDCFITVAIIPRFLL